MVEIFHCLGIHSHIQQAAIELLANSSRGYMRSDLFRLSLIKSLAPVNLKKLNSEIEALVEQKMLLRRLRHQQHEIGANKVIWILSPQTVRFVRDATKIAKKSLPLPRDISQLVRAVKREFRASRGAPEPVSEAALKILIARFAA
jgi:hypothetical protein